MRLIKTILGIGAASLLLLSTASHALNMDVGHTLTTDSPFHVGTQKFADILKEKSNGKITVTVFPHSQLGGEITMIQGAVAGATDLFVTGQPALNNVVKEFLVFDVPFLFDNVQQANEILAGPVGDKFMDILPKYGLVGLGWFSAIERNVFGDRAINTAADLKGMKIRVIQSPGYVESYKTLGAQATPMAYSELYLALQQKVIDGGETTPDQFVSDKFIEVSKYFNMTHINIHPALLVMSKTRWDALSADEQKMVKAAADEAMAYARDYYKKVYDEGMKTMAEKGVTVVYPSDLDSLVLATRPVVQKLVGQAPNGQALYDAVMAAKAKAKANP
ncbi:MAG: TRAP transporter substrate-binding protein [Achromobacter pulmonis]|uniref:2,3-diketo-L-gulonate-binding periplasmic protein YiaO n=1 Tax=Achromobacter pulmonis TaxID=1389932 RepID=A0A6S7EB59_9BURK|nr:TRAP transporter substrate-binding protein [Achromobacter pulmonis]MCF7766993.1 TRAP transporter substrate-binding protein [Achromobacter pulmonis]MPT28718.1 TRAP transporter substrate-binding protein [Achromobacter sp.]CAB3672186.1 2,3-diketo-L-gulonate-binding periplasmic protein YiaO [Achromobacter pulmonis]CAB3903424.1 2,3-diketo-L-gulonate-binding periplasmic protein YiaO [Achromobacter pulmonis]